MQRVYAHLLLGVTRRLHRAGRYDRLVKDKDLGSVMTILYVVIVVLIILLIVGRL